MVTPVIVDPLADGMPAPKTPLMSVPNMEDRKFDKLMNSKSNPAATTTAN
jgi:hypothetical protein